MKKYLLVLASLVLISCHENQAPLCTITLPLNTDVFLLGDSINISIDANDPDGEISTVLLYVDGTALVTLQDWPYNHTIHSLDYPTGDYTIGATATDNEGLQAQDEVHIKIGALSSVSTIAVSSIELESATVGGIVNDPGSEAVTETGIYIDTETNPEISGEKVLIGDGIGEFSTVITELEFGTAYYYKAYAVNSHGETLGEEVQFSTPPGIRDIDGNAYEIVLIGEQWWIRENLKTTRYNDGTGVALVEDSNEWAALSTPAYCWPDNDKEQYGDTYGALYNGYTIAAGNLCPENWRVPSDEDWIKLEKFMGMSVEVVYNTSARGTNEGGQLKETGFEHWTEPNEGALDSHNFTCLPSGYRFIDGSFLPPGKTAAIWTTTYHVADQIHRRGIGYRIAGINRSAYYVNGAFSVRCMKDE